MTLLSIVELVQLGVYLALAAVSVEQYRRHRGEAEAWLAGTVLILTALVVFGRQVHPDDTGLVAGLARRGLVVLLAVFPYALYRFTAKFSAHRRGTDRLALGATVAVALTALVLPALTPPEGAWPWWLAAYGVAVAVQWTALSVLSVVALARSGRHMPAVARSRMRLLAAAAVILNVALLILVGSGGEGTRSAVLQQSAGLVAGLCFLVGFTPPAMLRMVWRRQEIEAFRSGEAKLMAAGTETEVAGIVLPHATELVGARAAVLVDADGTVRGHSGVGTAGAAAIAARLGQADGRQGEPVILDDLVAVPVRSGWLAVVTTPATPVFGSEEIGLLGTLAHLAGLAFDRIELFARERVSRLALAEREAQLAEAQHTAQIGSYAWDPQTRHVTWSDEMFRLFGFEPGAPIDHGAAFSSRLHPDDRERVEAAWNASFDAVVPSSIEYRIVHCDGTVRWLQGRVQPLVDDAGRCRRIVGTVQDVTDRKHAESQLREAIEREQRMVAELRELAQARTDFVSTISHELRTPLTSIAGYVELLADGAVGPLSRNQLDVLEVVDRNARRLTSLIEDLLTLGRIDSGGFGLSTAPLDVMAMVEGVHRTVLPSAYSRGLSLTLDVDPGIGTVMGDGAQLERVLLNLLTNAIKFTPEGGDVAVRVWRDGEEVTFRVSDTGIGVPADEQAQLFDRFFRSSTATDRAIQGTGLGLSIVKTIVEKHAGTVDIESAPGVGSTVTVTLPAAGSPDAAISPPRLAS